MNGGHTVFLFLAGIKISLQQISRPFVGPELIQRPENEVHHFHLVMTSKIRGDYLHSSMLCHSMYSDFMFFQ